MREKILRIERSFIGKKLTGLPWEKLIIVVKSIDEAGKYFGSCHYLFRTIIES